MSNIIPHIQAGSPAKAGQASTPHLAFVLQTGQMLSYCALFLFINC